MADKAWTTTALDSNKANPTQPRTELEILKASKLSFRTHPRNTPPKQQQAEMPEGGWSNPYLQQ